MDCCLSFSHMHPCMDAVSLWVHRPVEGHREGWPVQRGILRSVKVFSEVPLNFLKMEHIVVVHVVTTSPTGVAVVQQPYAELLL